MRKVLGLLGCLICLPLMSASLPAQTRGRQVSVSDDQSDRPKIDVELYTVDVTLLPEEHRLTGKAEIRFKQLDRQTYAVFDLDRRLRVEKTTINGAEARFRQFDVDSTLWIDLATQPFNKH